MRQTVPEQVPENIPEQVPEKVREKVAGQVHEEVREKVPEQVPEQVPKQTRFQRKTWTTKRLSQWRFVLLGTLFALAPINSRLFTPPSCHLHGPLSETPSCHLHGPLSNRDLSLPTNYHINPNTSKQFHFKAIIIPQQRNIGHNKDFGAISERASEQVPDEVPPRIRRKFDKRDSGAGSREGLGKGTGTDP